MNVPLHDFPFEILKSMSLSSDETRICRREDERANKLPQSCPTYRRKLLKEVTQPDVCPAVKLDSDFIQNNSLSMKVLKRNGVLKKYSTFNSKSSITEIAIFINDINKEINTKDFELFLDSALCLCWFVYLIECKEPTVRPILIKCWLPVCIYWHRSSLKNSVIVLMFLLA